MKALGFLTWFAVSSLLHAMCIWRWFMSHEYGHGPSLGAWFGIATIAGFLIRMNGPHKKTEHKDFDDQIKESIMTSLGLWLGCLLVLGVSWCIGWATGWIG